MLKQKEATQKRRTNLSAKGFKTLSSRILTFVGGPVILAFLAVSFVMLTLVSATVTDLTANELSAESESAAHEINGFFRKYYDLTEQLSYNSGVRALFDDVMPGVILEQQEGLPPIKKTMENIQA
ncbi:MAG: hypothetical protein AAGU02_07530, partial [Lawsonibacter sp.]